jgi:hypothetical protein
MPFAVAFDAIRQRMAPPMERKLAIRYPTLIRKEAFRWPEVSATTSGGVAAEGPEGRDISPRFPTFCPARMWHL